MNSERDRKMGNQPGKSFRGLQYKIDHSYFYDEATALEAIDDCVLANEEAIMNEQQAGTAQTYYVDIGKPIGTGVLIQKVQGKDMRT
jgi:hypothetical protein